MQHKNVVSMQVHKFVFCEVPIFARIWLNVQQAEATSIQELLRMHIIVSRIIQYTQYCFMCVESEKAPWGKL